LVSPTIPSLALHAINNIHGAENDSSLTLSLFFGFTSFLLFLALTYRYLPRSRRPLLTCLICGTLAAPGPFTLFYTAGFLLFGGAEMALAIFIGMLVIIGPFGMIGGALFWACLFWRSEDYEQLKMARAAQDFS